MKKNKASSISIRVNLPLKTAEAFDVIVEELELSLTRFGIQFEPGSKGRIVQNDFDVGRVIKWKPGKQIVYQWRQASWSPDEITKVIFIFQEVKNGTQLNIKCTKPGSLIGEGNEAAGWYTSEIITPLLRAISPASLGDWITDRRARRPSGSQSRAVYRDPLYHYPNFRVILSELALTASDYLLDVGCGGGAFLKDALKSGCLAAGIDHSADMVQLARNENRKAIKEGRASILEADATNLPFSDEEFTCVSMTGVLGFLPDPVKAFSEICRVLKKSGRFMVMGSDPKLRGTPAAPEPLASRLRFYEDDKLKALARKAGFIKVEIQKHSMEKHAKDVGIPEEHVVLFSNRTSFLMAQK